MSSITKRPQTLFAMAQAVYNESFRMKLTLLGAGVAFFGLLALFPGIGAMMAIAGILADPQQVVDQLSVLQGVVPQAAYDIIVNQAQSVAGSDSGGLGLAALFGILVALYSASKAMQGLMDGLNLIHETEEDRGIIRATLTKLGLTLGLILGVLFCVAVAAIVPAVLTWLPLGGATETAVMLLRWPVLLAIAAFGMILTYRIAPARHFRGWGPLVPGAALACVMWIVGSAAFAIYVRYFGSYNETFGAIGGTIILLVWMWLSSCIVLLGALVSKLLERKSSERKVSRESEA
ncbi:YihY/virulence factor BrkB family protein [Palleronia sp. LCG004]|uniref:YihY/virulence factor BrkB family protein n=1 Tax=Palleronia sp. LCG004 TaxID=3079304 RepID=UPI002943BE4C|nr:YihY/virulence factor BrkB family protein [Palleronia sp. LCG004]WOI55192.1 YihY/virulence factor BrkB family protein [Palleronia sp. LCG004]